MYNPSKIPLNNQSDTQYTKNHNVEFETYSSNSKNSSNGILGKRKNDNINTNN